MTILAPGSMPISEDVSEEVPGTRTTSTTNHTPEAPSDARALRTRCASGFGVAGAAMLLYSLLGANN